MMYGLGQANLISTMVVMIITEEEEVTKPPKRWESLPWPVPARKDELTGRSASGVVVELYLPPDRETVEGIIQHVQPNSEEIPHFSSNQKESNWEIVPDEESEGGFKVVEQSSLKSQESNSSKDPDAITFIDEEVGNENRFSNQGNHWSANLQLSSNNTNVITQIPPASALRKGIESASVVGTGVSAANAQQGQSSNILGRGVSSGSFIGTGVSALDRPQRPSSDKLGHQVSSASVVGTGVSVGNGRETPPSSVLMSGMNSGDVTSGSEPQEPSWSRQGSNRKSRRYQSKNKNRENAQGPILDSQNYDLSGFRNSDQYTGRPQMPGGRRAPGVQGQNTANVPNFNIGVPNYASTGHNTQTSSWKIEPASGQIGELNRGHSQGSSNYNTAASNSAYPGYNPQTSSWNIDPPVNHNGRHNSGHFHSSSNSGSPPTPDWNIAPAGSQSGGQHRDLSHGPTNWNVSPPNSGSTGYNYQASNWNFGSVGGQSNSQNPPSWNVGSSNYGQHKGQSQGSSHPDSPGHNPHTYNWNIGPAEGHYKGHSQGSTNWNTDSVSHSSPGYNPHTVNWNIGPAGAGGGGGQNRGQHISQSQNPPSWNAGSSNYGSPGYNPQNSDWNSGTAGGHNGGNFQSSQWNFGSRGSTNDRQTPPSNRDSQHYNFKPASHWNAGSGIVPAASQQPSSTLGFTVLSGAAPVSALDMAKCPSGATGQFVYRPDCRRFLNCWKGRGFLQVCAPGTLFNPETLECDFPSKVKCLELTPEEERWNNFEVNKTGARHVIKEGRVLEITEKTTTLVPFLIKKTDCPMEGGTGLAPHPTDCSKFLNCWKGTAHTQQCAPGTLFNPVSLLCDFPSRVQGPNTGWGLVCDDRNSWTVVEATVVCRQLGYERGAELSWQGRPLRPTEDTLRIAVDRVLCGGNEAMFSACQLRYQQQCVIARDAVGVRCYKNWPSQCQPGEFNFGKQCYKLVVPSVRHAKEGFSHGEALRDCQTRGAQLLDITSQDENDFISEWLIQLEPNITNVLTSGVGVSVPYRSLWIWEGSLSPFKFNKWWPGWTNELTEAPKTGDRPICIVAKRVFPCEHAYYTSESIVDIDAHSHEQLRTSRMCGANYYYWDTEDCSITHSHPYICERPHDDVANVTTSGLPCIKWDDPQIVPILKYRVSERERRAKFVGHNFCRNVGNDPQPWCYAGKRRTREPCEIPPCYNKAVEKTVTIVVEECKPKEFECQRGQCIPEIWRCDGNKKAFCSTEDKFSRERESVCLLSDSNVGLSGGLIKQSGWDYYEMKSHSVVCDGRFKCDNGKCLNVSKICNGKNDCGDKSDEKNCSAEYIGYEIRLAGSNFTNEGRVEVKAFGRWGLICDDLFGLRDAEVICRDLGFSLGAAEILPPGSYLSRNNDDDPVILVDDLKCLGNETSLLQCEFEGWGVHDCLPEEAVSLVCSIPGQTCAAGYWQCETSKECLPIAYMCDNIEDCDDASDEDRKRCSLEGISNMKRVRLMKKIKAGKSNVNVTMEVSYRLDDPRHSRSLLKRGSRMDDITQPLNLPFCPSNVKPAKKVDVDRLLKQRFGEEWRNMPELKFYADIVDYQGIVTKNEEENERCDCLDEGEGFGMSPVELRLVGGSNNMEGRVEVRYHGIWGTVCDDDFAAPAAAVICRSLGFTGPSKAKKDGAFGAGEGQIWLDQLHCAGNETNPHQTPEERSLETNIIPVNKILPSQCGKRLKNLNELDLASVRVRTGAKSVHWCGAVIISPLHVLTAGHCLQDYTKGAYFIRVGDHDTEENEGTEQELNIDEYYLHEDFNKGKRLNHDIAVVKLKGLGIQLGPGIVPACLPRHGLQNMPGLNCTISGWGSMKSAGSGYARRLRAAWIPLLPQETCKASFVYGADAIGEGMFCAGQLEGGVDSCQGDSGGPIICLLNDEFTLFGITSWGHGCGRANKPGVYSNVSYYREWIDRKLEDSMSGR
ncbi:hypothetical protein C0J52_12660 [Blattella germanica]|nr:hypothetical protein C0J52_12660 [Blattella germanica]